jgi:hypothetical protein
MTIDFLNDDGFRREGNAVVPATRLTARASTCWRRAICVARLCCKKNGQGQANDYVRTRLNDLLETA